MKISPIEVQKILKTHGIKIGFLKAKVIAYIARNGKTKATDLDKALQFSAWRRANDLKHKELLMVEEIEKPSTFLATERFYYNLSPFLISALKQGKY